MRIVFASVPILQRSDMLSKDICHYMNVVSGKERCYGTTAQQQFVNQEYLSFVLSRPKAFVDI